MNLSYRANEIFNFLYGEGDTLRASCYRGFYDVLSWKGANRRFLQDNHLVRFVSVNDCLRLLEKMEFKQFCLKIRTDYVQKLHEVYTFLKDYN